MLLTSSPAQSSASIEHALAAAAMARRRVTSKSRRVSPLLVAALAGSADLLGLVMTGLISALAWIGSGELSGSSYIVAVLATSLASVLVAERLDLYSVPALRQPLRHLWLIATAWMVALGGLVATIFLLKAGIEFSRGWLLLWLASGLASSLAARGAAQSILGRLTAAGRLQRRAVVFGAGEAGATLVAQLRADPASDVEIAGIFDDRGADRVPASLKQYPLLGKVEQLIAFCRSNEVDLLILSLPITAERRLLEILKQLWVLPIDIRLAAHATNLRLRPRAYSHVGSVPLLDLYDRPLGDGDRFVKAAFDRVVAFLALVLLSPVMAAVAVAVRLDSKGPIFFRQKRLGFNNEPIDVWKFRSMYVEASDATASKLVTKGDPRVTPVGRIIRKTSLDELPQLFNVLAGTLSLVGPRPHALNAKAADRLYHEVADGYFARHKVKPGITGLAQIRGWRGETDTEEKLKGRVASDLEYIESWSLLLDVYILAKTPLALLKSDNAY
ncbi:MAG: undecaprenyl-phosphate glucose phosphotransferase [Proteobacteria bacterium]|nr:undecaprenyl-phosphate glucose phosphotransferase [Pseudomonadota bacterium]